MRARCLRRFDFKDDTRNLFFRDDRSTLIADKLRLLRDDLAEAS